MNAARKKRRLLGSWSDNMCRSVRDQLPNGGETAQESRGEVVGIDGNGDVVGWGMVSCRVRDWKWAGQGQDRPGAVWCGVVWCGAVYGVQLYCRASGFQVWRGFRLCVSGRGPTLKWKSHSGRAQASSGTGYLQYKRTAYDEHYFKGGQEGTQKGSLQVDWWRGGAAPKQ